MKMAPIAEVKAKFSEYINECKNGTVIVTKNGRPAAALISIDGDDDLERILFSNSKRLHEILEAAENRIKKTGGLSHKEVWEQIFSENPKSKGGSTGRSHR